MTVKELAQSLALQPVVLPHPDKEVAGGYAGDLLSWVMGNAGEGCAWLTIMTNRNIVAVAKLLDIACIIITEGSQAEAEVAELAQAQGVNLLASQEDTFTLAAKAAALL